jgi:phosphoenolpyruvate carboxykinase (GTP)
VLRVDAEEWRRELPAIRATFESLGERLPPALGDELDALAARLEGG